MRFKMFLVLAALALMWYGGQKAYVAATNRAPTKLTVAEFEAGKSDAVWVELTDGYIDYEHAITFESKVLKVDKGTFVPVLPSKGTHGPAAVLIEMKTSEVEGRIDRTVESLKTRVAMPGDRTETISGMLEWGITGVNSKVRRALEKAAAEGRIDHRFKILKEGEAPSAADLPVGAAMFLTPPGIIAVWFFALRKKPARAPLLGDPMPPASPSNPVPPLPPQQ